MDGDPFVRRIVRESAVFCLAAAALLFAVGGWAMSAGVLGGGLLIGVSLHTIGRGISAILAAASGGATSQGMMKRSLLQLVLRYALLGFLAYVMIARLRLHPVGLLVGASSVTAAALLEAVRFLAKKTT
ncbi:MAG TPA: hypothetical protein VJ813_19135 [Vicinamibacterales bacterium]|nr:hypothetical protein [Vicinamibacterales bacterium]